ncbi:mercury methylation corrinoid protein HgcA [Desulfomicrobium salsuginis]
MDDLPGYRIEHYVEAFTPTAAGRIPRLRTSPTAQDRLGTCRARLGLDRNHYTVNPGLYAVGAPGPDSPVVVTANYKLTFDTVRFALAGRDVWLLVVDTRGINVWCAGGKGTFSAAGVSEQVKKTGLERVVSHRRLILPQLGANGVRARDLRKACGFEAVFGPVRAEDLPRYLDHGVDEAMREVTFSLRERAAVIPVELVLGWKLILAAFLVAAVLSLIGPDFSLRTTGQRWLMAASATGLGLAAGAILFPLLLPALRTRLFSLGGAGLGLALAVLLPAIFPAQPDIGVLGAGLWTVVLASWLGLNFTGSTPYTSPSGVEKEMRRAIPVQAAGTLVAAALFVVGNFT